MRYSPLEHLFDAILVNRSPQDIYFVMAKSFTAYQDASGDNSADGVCSAVFIATVGQWKNFDYDWRLLLQKHGLPEAPFHTTDFMNKHGLYSTWWKQENANLKERSFFIEAVGLIVHHTRYSAAAAILKSDVEYMKRTYPELAIVKAKMLTWCGMFALGNLKDWMDARNLTKENVKFVHEQGDAQLGHLIDEAYKTYGFSLGVEPKLAHTVFDPADLLGWGLRKGYIQHATGVPKDHFFYKAAHMDKVLNGKYTVLSRAYLDGLCGDLRKATQDPHA